MSDEIQVEVTWDDINRSRYPCGSPHRCPIIRALERLGISSYVTMGARAVSTSQGNRYTLPLAAQMFIGRFDNDYSVKPFSFTMQESKEPFQVKESSFHPWSDPDDQR